ncbi:EXS_family protein [Hexamita inflata]|uniref:EXS family protein n=1 Tax=Hexamita inflata TaxID=28002 RepID=A0AA86QAY8_9EUKA|nr:EXS family protein [Hexamita inflata]
MQLETNPEWHDKYVRYKYLMNICQQIIQHDLQDKEKVRHHASTTSLQSRATSASHQASLIKTLSKKFLEEIQKDFFVVDSVFKNEISKIKQLAEHAVQMSSKAQAINLEKHKCNVVTAKMQECLNQSTLLQNYAIQNQEMFIKLINRHDTASTHTYDANRWFVEIVKASPFYKKDQFDLIEHELSTSYAALFNVSQKRAIHQLQTQSVQEDVNYEAKTVLTVGTGCYFGGILTMLILTFINAIIYTLEFSSHLELSKIQEMCIRTHFVIATTLLGFGFILLVFHRAKLNYGFLLQLPNTVLKLGHRKMIMVGTIHFCIVVVFSLFCVMDQLMGEQDVIPIMFGQYMYKFLKIMNPTYWLIFPTLCLPLYSIINVINAKGQPCMFQYAMEMLFKIFTPWRQKVEFPHFFFCVLLISVRDTFKDIIAIIGVDKINSIVLIAVENIFAICRVFQGYFRFRENNKFYTQGFYMIQYNLNILSSFYHIVSVSEEEHVTAYWIFIGFKAAESIYKMYWDIFEDWGLWLGGSSAKKFKDKPDKWLTKRYVRRPTHIPLPAIIFFNVFDYLALWIWLPIVFKGYHEYRENFWYNWLVYEVEVIRRLFWMIMRLDNQESTNVEQYLVSSYVPLVIAEYEKQHIIKEQQLKSDSIIVNQLEELQLIFNNKNGKEHILSVAQSFESTKLMLKNFDVDNALNQLKQNSQFRSRKNSTVEKLDLKKYERNEGENLIQSEIKIDENGPIMEQRLKEEYTQKLEIKNENKEEINKIQKDNNNQAKENKNENKEPNDIRNTQNNEKEHKRETESKLKEKHKKTHKNHDTVEHLEKDKVLDDSVLK